MQITDKITITNEDNMLLMARYPDNYFSLAICDPPYGIGDKFKGGKSGKMQFNEVVDKGWDSVPSDEYFKELFRVSKNQIIWGGNYFDLPKNKCFVIWDKQQPEDVSFAMCEYAWASFDSVAKIFKKRTQGQEDRFHPTQKPIYLYQFLLKHFAKPNDKILDTHLGSGSIAIACHDYGFELTGCELDESYYNSAMKRIKNHISQTKLF